MDPFEMEDIVALPSQSEVSPLKDWRLKYQAGTLQKNDFIDFFQKQSRQYFVFQNEGGIVKTMFKESGAKEGIIDVLLEFILGDNPIIVLEKLRLEGNTASVCGKVFKNGEPTYSCRECGMDPTCVLCVNCFKQSAHRYHKYKMSTSGGGGCCDCGDEEAWKKDQYCEEHMRGRDNSVKSTVITDSMRERCEVAFEAIVSFCVTFLEIESNASFKCLDGDGDTEDYFCTVLYNDESHTFDQVIQTLTKITKCQHKDAMEIVASIDREGRAVVKTYHFFDCYQMKEAIEKHSVSTNAASSRWNQPLRVSVLHVRAIACQQFSLQLLTWFQEFLMRHCTFRQIFVNIISDKNAPYSIRHILEYDVKLWKAARTAWHRLLISGMLMEYENKMLLAQEFSRHYASIVQDFIRDDHEHAFSIVSLSVQLFTVPSIAHHLIAHEGIFYKLLHTFYHESIEKYIQNKTLHFHKNMPTLGFFKRAAYILYDLRYLLSFKPVVWTPELREGFLEGCKALLRLLNVMQGMESMTRQTGQHMDYEPEWECAFNLHIKLANTISLVIDWCASDREVLIKLYQMVMRYIVNNTFVVGQGKYEEKTIASHVANCIVYDVASKPVSIHLPLSRLFAGIFLHLGSYGITFDNAMCSGKRPPEEIIEPILCTQTMIAQVHSGMWRRNGYSLLHQLYFYRNVRCRSEMLDRDIIGMQIGGALIESNQYLIHLLNKFNLIDWMQSNFETSLNMTDDDFIKLLSMIDEFLELLIVIIGERYMPGVARVTEEERFKKEIIQLLCIKPYSHSELNRALPDSNNDTVLEEVIESVATFKKPSLIDAKGIFELKEEYFDDYNMYFYHYTKEDKSKSEETQRLRRKSKNELVCCPPPKLPKLRPEFLSLANLLQCDVMISIMNVVLDRALDLRAKSFQENHLQKVLYLIGYGLQEELSENYPFLSFYEHAHKQKIIVKLEELSHSQRVEAHRDFIIWIVKKFKEVQQKLAFKQNDERNCENMDLQAEEDDSTKVSSVEQEKQKKEERTRLAAERRAKIMAQMQSAQRNFMKSNADMFASSNAVAVASESSTKMEWQEESNEEGAAAYNSVACLGVGRRLQHPEEQNFKCILCFEDCTVRRDGPTLVYSAFMQKSKVLSSDTRYDSSVHTSSCGHVMHVTCWQEYYNNEESKEQRRAPRSRQPLMPSYNTEFQCPYCRCLSNGVLPVTAPLSKFSPPNVVHPGDEILPIDLWIEVLKSFTDDMERMSQIDEADEELFGESKSPAMVSLKSIIEQAQLGVDVDQFEKLLHPINKFELPDSWTNLVQHYIKVARSFSPRSADAYEHEGLQWMWQSCIYTVRSLEMLYRASNRPLHNYMSIRHKSCMSGLIRACCLYSASMSATDKKNVVQPAFELLNTVFRQKGPSIMEWNCFNMLVSTIFMVPNLLYSKDETKVCVAIGSMADFYTLQLFFLANMVKAILSFELPTDKVDDCMDTVEDEFESEGKSLPEKLRENVAEFYRKYNLEARRKAYAEARKLQSESGEEMASPCVSIECNTQTISALFDYIKQEMREFLRCCCLFFHFVTDVEFPADVLTQGDTYENMCKYLGLPTSLRTYFDNESYYATILETFASHHDILYYDFASNTKRNGEIFTPVPCTRPVPKLIALPEDFSDLINSVSDFFCPNNEREEMKTPTMCLICGEILCGQSYCCQPELEQRNVGACTYHVNLCSAEVGLFLRIRDCQVVFLGRNKGCFVLPPYLDEYGETDQGLRRGNPLRLCASRYNKIHLMWLGHGLHEEIARLNDITAVTVTQWYHM